ncbi:3-ketodihydrosphingosine reductase tsc-10 [Hypoxylon fragiforme]|uniref:3-ketodihydrosphingosine reductase tsc-10 n=1 Tax=Hypoxylon fragiforme TaxID=63214 RepID=UPI0020C61E80|nr:3-ketodihydrosphingosine reductase tsc-10 [Hypoxylon fragiforme]KAI2612739.1 3-ketodihydrosphingosine reductase tsc-10 [Hypoxylon fragiforme]
MDWFNHNHMPVEGRTILLTGGSEGTGFSAARIFSSKGANVIIVSRNPIKLEEAIEALRAAAKCPRTQRFHTIEADVAEPNYAEGVVADATAWNRGVPPEIVWCLAGIATPMLWTDDGAMKAARYNMDVNYFGSAELSRAMMRAWLLAEQEKKRYLIPDPRPPPKHIIFTGPITSTLVATAGHAPHAPSRFALRALADALAMETRLYPDLPMAVHLVLPHPAAAAAASYDEARPHSTIAPPQIKGAETPQDPDDAARAAIAGIERGRYFVATSWLGELVRWGAIGGSPRNSWVVDTLMGWVVPLVMAFWMWDLRAQVAAWNQKKKVL